MKKIFSNPLATLAILTPILLTSCGRNSQTELQPPSLLKTPLALQNMNFVSSYPTVQSENILIDQNMKWELNTTIFCEGDPINKTEILNNNTDEIFLLDPGKKCSIFVNSFNFNGNVYKAKQTPFVINFDENLHTENLKNSVEYDSDKQSDALYFNAESTDAKGLFIAFSSSPNLLDNDSIVPINYKLEYKNDDKVVTLNSDLPVDKDNAVAFSMPDSPFPADHEVTWAIFGEPEQIKVNVKDLKTNKLYAITLNASSFASNPVCKLEAAYCRPVKLNTTRDWGGQGTTNFYTDQFYLSFARNDNQELPINAIYSGELFLNALGYKKSFYKNIQVDITINN